MDERRRLPLRVKSRHKTTQLGMSALPPITEIQTDVADHVLVVIQAP
jgi:hypothetical protein